MLLWLSYSMIAFSDPKLRSYARAEGTLAMHRGKVVYKTFVYIRSCYEVLKSFIGCGYGCGMYVVSPPLAIKKCPQTPLVGVC